MYSMLLLYETPEMETSAQLECRAINLPTLSFVTLSGIAQLLPLNEPNLRIAGAMRMNQNGQVIY